MYNYYHICGVIGTLAFFMINTVSNAHLSDGSMYEDVSSFITKYSCCPPEIEFRMFHLPSVMISRRSLRTYVRLVLLPLEVSET